MNIKRRLKQQAKQDRKAILEADGGEFLRKMQATIQSEPKTRPRLRVWLPAVCSAAAACAVLIACLAVYAPLNERVEYLEQNVVYSSSSLEEMNKNVKNFDFHFDDSFYSYTVDKATDSVSGDLLFYSTDVESTTDDNIIYFTIVAVCNPKYKYKSFSLSDSASSVVLNNYTVKYDSWMQYDSQWDISTLNVIAETHKGKEYVYVSEYKEALLNSSDGSFLEVLQSVVK